MISVAMGNGYTQLLWTLVVNTVHKNVLYTHPPIAILHNNAWHYNSTCSVVLEMLWTHNGTDEVLAVVGDFPDDRIPSHCQDSLYTVMCVCEKRERGRGGGIALKKNLVHGMQ